MSLTIEPDGRFCAKGIVRQLPGRRRAYASRRFDTRGRHARRPVQPALGRPPGHFVANPRAIPHGRIDHRGRRGPWIL